MAVAEAVWAGLKKGDSAFRSWAACGMPPKTEGIALDITILGEGIDRQAWARHRRPTRRHPAPDQIPLLANVVSPAA